MVSCHITVVSPSDTWYSVLIKGQRKGARGRRYLLVEASQNPLRGGLYIYLQAADAALIINDHAMQEKV